MCLVSRGRRHFVAIVSMALLGTTVGEPTAQVNAGVPPSVIPLSEGFEAGYGTFNSSSTGCPTIGCLWTVVTSHANTGTYAAYADDVKETGDQFLFLGPALAIPVRATSATLTFWHLYDFESDDVFNYYGMAVAYTMVDTLRKAGRNLTRAGVLKAATHLNEVNPFLLPGVRIQTSPSDYYPMDKVKLARYKGDHWQFFGNLVRARD